jgi:hypothetical protein
MSAQTEMQRAISRLTETKQYTPVQPVVAEITFSEPVTITVADLRVGDFVVLIPEYKRIRAVSFNSAVKTISESRYGGWYTQSRPRGPKISVLSRSFSTVAGAPVAWHYPVDTPVIVRRPAVQQLTLDEQISKLCEAVDAAERDVTADQGADVLDAGAWVEVTRAVIALAGPEISDEAKRAVARMTGLDDYASDEE